MSNDSDLQLSFKDRQKLFNDILSKSANSVALAKSPEVPPRNVKNKTIDHKPLDIPPELPPRRPSINSHDEENEGSKIKRRETRRAVKIKKSTIRRSVSPNKVPPSPKSDRVSRSPTPDVSLRRNSRSPGNYGPPRIQTRAPKSVSRSPSPRRNETVRRSTSPCRFSDTPPPITSKPPPSRIRSRSASPNTIKRRPENSNTYNTTIKLKSSDLSNGQYNYAKNTGTTARKPVKGIVPSRKAPSPPRSSHPYRVLPNIPSVDVAINSATYNKMNRPAVNLSTHPMYKFQSLSMRHPKCPPPPIPRKNFQPFPTCPDVPPPPPRTGSSTVLEHNISEDTKLGSVDDQADYYEDDDDIYGAITGIDHDDLDQVNFDAEPIVIRKEVESVPLPSIKSSSGFRELWCERAEVVNSGLLDTMDKKQKARQEAMYEILTSEETYKKALETLERKFLLDNILMTGYLCEDDEDDDETDIFGNIEDIIDCSRRLYEDLKLLYTGTAAIDTIVPLLSRYVDKEFSIYIRYCSHTSLQQQIISEKRKQNDEFDKFLLGLETDLNGQNLQAFLLQPMQRICRFPLLLSAVISNTPDDNQDKEPLQQLHQRVSSIVDKCNEGARKSEVRRAMFDLEKLCDFTKIQRRMTSFTGNPDRLIIKEGPVAKLEFKGTKTSSKQLYMWLFTDCLVIGARLDPKDATSTSRRNSTFVTYAQKWTLTEHCPRQLIKTVAHFSPPRGISYNNSKNPSETIFYLKLFLPLDNQNKRTRLSNHIIKCPSAQEKEKWLELLTPKVEQQNEDETIYADWDTPVYRALYDYSPINDGDLHLYAGDEIKVLKRYNDGWCYGERKRGNEKGWFPGVYTEEIESEHSNFKKIREKQELLDNIAANPKAIEILSKMNTSR